MSDVNPCLSEDIWYEIFKELPVKTLGKCRWVCKSWYSLIVSPCFMAAHLKNYTRNHSHSLILCKEVSKRLGTVGYENCIFFRNLDQLKQGNRLHTSICPFFVRPACKSSFHFVGSVNGLLCISDSDYLGPRDRILIWNPLIQKSIKLPKSPFMGCYSVLGFGYDYQRNDHRVVKISYSDISTPFVEVYSVQERKWKTVCSKYLVDNLINNVSPSHCFCNGVIHWPIFSTESVMGCSSCECLLLFNVAEERFEKMEMPAEIVKSDPGDFSIFDYYGMLAVSCCEYMFFGIVLTVKCQIWVKRDYNVESSWCKILDDFMSCGYCFKGSFQYLGPKEELIGFAKGTTGQIVSYDLRNRQITELGFNVSQSAKFCTYSESLALLDKKIDKRTVAELKRSGISEWWRIWQ